MFLFFNFVLVVASIKHNTHTGQWLTTFKAVWHPQRDDVFVVGSMEQPRGVSWANDIWNILRQCSPMIELLAFLICVLEFSWFPLVPPRKPCIWLWVVLACNGYCDQFIILTTKSSIWPKCIDFYVQMRTSKNSCQMFLEYVEFSSCIVSDPFVQL